MNELIQIAAGDTDFDIDGMVKADFSKPDWCEYLADFWAGEREFELTNKLNAFKDKGKEVGVTNVAALWSGYLKQYLKAPTKDVTADNVSHFLGLAESRQLNTGEWTANSAGISRWDDHGEIIACRHPILPVERIISIDTGLEMIRLQYTRSGPNDWRTIVVPKSLLASPQRILDLADRGVSVTSENAKHLITYLQVAEDLNYNDIPETRATSRLGWIDTGEFSPYAPGLQFDETSSFGKQFESVKAVGDYDAWLKLVKDYRKRNIVFRIFLAASFGSILLKDLSVLPSFVHLWTDLSGSGKSVALMMAASVWGNPDSGQYMQTFNSTVVASERLAEFHNSLPLCMDELQQAKDDRGRKQFSVYKLAQGSGRARSTKFGGLEKTPTWRNFILTTGETPLVDLTEGEGAMARVISIELKQPLMTLEEGGEIASLLIANYGHAGKRFVEALMAEDTPFTKEVFREIYKAYRDELSQVPDVQSKQAMSAAAILVGDTLASQIIFGDTPMTVSDITPYMAKRSETDVGNRALELMKGFVAQNMNSFLDYRPNSSRAEVFGEVLGVVEGDYTYINGTVFDKVMSDNGFQPQAILSAWDRSDMIRTDRTSKKVNKKINGKSSRHVALKNEPEDMDDDDGYSGYRPVTSGYKP